MGKKWGRGINSWDSSLWAGLRYHSLSKERPLSLSEGLWQLSIFLPLLVFGDKHIAPGILALRATFSLVVSLYSEKSSIIKLSSNYPNLRVSFFTCCVDPDNYRYSKRVFILENFGNYCLIYRRTFIFPPPSTFLH